MKEREEMEEGEVSALLESREITPSSGVWADGRGDGLSRLEHDDDGCRGGAGRQHSQDEREAVVHGVVPHRAHALTLSSVHRGASATPSDCSPDSPHFTFCTTPNHTTEPQSQLKTSTSSS